MRAPKSSAGPGNRPAEAPSAGDPALLAANLALFEDRFPAAAAAIRALAEPRTQAVIEDGCIADIDLGGDRLYGMPVDDYVRRQIEAYFAKPERFVLNQPEGAYLSSAVSLRMLGFMVAACRDRNIEILLGQPEDVVGYLVVFGVGLGRHLAPLLARTSARHVVAVEPFAEFLRHSLEAVDWADIVRTIDDRQGSLTLIVDDDPQTIANRIIGVVREHGASLLDGSYLFVHYDHWLTRQAHSRFKEHAPYQTMALGFYEDEVLMIANSAANLMRHPFRLITGDPRPQRKEPAFIVASGPSLDESIGTIARWKDHAVIFSSGSSLQALLGHGIVPDYHVELENVPQVVDFLRHILERNSRLFPEGRFTGMRLIASATVDPGVPPLFDETYLFFRDTVSSSHTYGTGVRRIYLIAPNVSNTSLAVAAVLGFCEVYLFGTDCGMRERRRHHSRDTAYFTSDKFKSPTEGQDEGAYTYPGNFGGMVYTDLTLNWNRQFLEEAIRLYRLRAFNCSDGVTIEGALPKVAESVAFAHAPLDKAAIAAAIRAASPALAPGAFFAGRDRQVFVAECERLARDFAAVLEAAGEDPDFEHFYKRVTAFLRTLDDGYSGVGRMISGSAYGIPLIATYYLNRIGDTGTRAEIFASFREEYAHIIDEMCADARALFARIAETPLPDAASDARPPAG